MRLPVSRGPKSPRTLRSYHVGRYSSRGTERSNGPRSCPRQGLSSTVSLVSHVSWRHGLNTVFLKRMVRIERAGNTVERVVEQGRGHSSRWRELELLGSN
jgi:hypothetical protein